MINQPLNSSEQAKLLIFTLLMLPSIVFLVGLIPALFLSFGLFTMKKNESFSHVETAVRHFNGYVGCILVGCICFMAYYGSTYGNSDYYYHSAYFAPEWEYEKEFTVVSVFAGISIFYLTIVKVLFLTPLKAHSEWVPVNGIFSSKPKASKIQTEDSEIDIIKSEKLKYYSVADELIKWAKLKEDGLISENEFNEARAKILKRN